MKHNAPTMAQGTNNLIVDFLRNGPVENIANLGGKSPAMKRSDVNHNNPSREARHVFPCRLRAVVRVITKL